METEKIVAADLAFYLPGRSTELGPGAVWPRGTKGR